MSSLFSCLGKKSKSKKKRNGKPPETKSVEEEPKEDNRKEHPIDENTPTDKINGHITIDDKGTNDSQQTESVECIEEPQQVILIKELKSKLNDKVDKTQNGTEIKDHSDYVQLAVSTTETKNVNEQVPVVADIIEDAAIKSVEAEIVKIEAISKESKKPQLSKSESISETALKQTNLQLSEQNQNFRKVREEHERLISKQKEEISSLKKECLALKANLTNQTKLQDAVKERDEIVASIGDLTNVCTSLKLRLDKVENEKEAKTKSSSDVEFKLAAVDSDHQEINSSIKNALKSVQELECRVINLELDKESQDDCKNDEMLSSFKELEICKSKYEEDLALALNKGTEFQNILKNMESQINDLKIEISRLQEENKQYKDQLEEAYNSSHVKDEKISSIKNTEASLHNTIHNLESKLDHYEARHKSDSEEIAVSKSKLEKLEKQLREKEIAHQDTIKKLSDAQNKQEDLQKRMSGLAIEKPAANSVLSVPLLSSVQSPEKIGEKFRELYSTAWCEAYEKLNTVCKRDERKTLLILMEYLTECYLYSRRTARHQMDALLSLLASPTNMRGSLNKRLQGKTGHINNIPVALKQNIMAFRRSPSENFIESIFEEFMNQVDYQKSRHLRNIQARDITEVAPFVRKCIGVCWELVTQEPPMYLLFKLRHNQIIEKDKFEVYSSDGNKVDFLVWPALLRDEHGPLLQKGVVQAIRS